MLEIILSHPLTYVFVAYAALIVGVNIYHAFRVKRRDASLHRGARS
jgi:hypothetical protein